MFSFFKKTFTSTVSTMPVAIKNTVVEDDSNAKPKNPWVIAAVLETLFGFMKLEDLKNFRLVSREWNHVVEPFLRKLSKISFGYPNRPSTFKKTLESFKKQFQYSGTSAKFTALELLPTMWDKSHWPKDVLIKYVRHFSPGMNELGLDRIHILGYGDTKINISEILTGIQMKNITKLTVRGGDGTSLNFHVDQLDHIKYLNLRYCALYYGAKAKLSPIEMFLHGVKLPFEDQAQTRKTVVLNKFISFENMKVCKIVDHYYGSMLDLSGSNQLDVLSLEGVSISNWNISRWTVEKFDLTPDFGMRISLSGETTIQVSQMSFICCKLSSSSIPGMLTSLYIAEIHCMDDAELTFSSNIYLPNLRYLKISSYKNRFASFKSCPNLESLDISIDDPKKSLALETIPESVKNILFNTTVTIVGQGTRKLKTLILHEHHFKNAGERLAKLQAEHIVYLSSRFHDINFTHSEEAIQFLKGDFKTLAIGPMKWNSQPLTFEASLISKMVDEQSEYYLFKGSPACRKGVPLEKSKFEKMLDLHALTFGPEVATSGSTRAMRAATRQQNFNLLTFG